MDESGFEQKVIRDFGYRPVGKPCINTYNYQKTERTKALGRYIKKAYLPWTRLLRISIGKWCITGLSITSLQSSVANVSSSWIMPDFIRTNVLKSY